MKLEPASPRAVLLPVVVGAVLAVAVVLRFLTESDLWLDEALTVNVARLPLSELAGALKHDGAPPLHYALLHGWMLVFGTSDLAVRALSGVLGVAMLPLAFLAGRRLGGDGPRGRWVAWSAVLMVAASPYAIRYSTEARMYMLAMVLVLLGYLALWRAVDRSSLGALTAVALVTAALLYTQYWSFFLVGVLGLLQVWRAVRTRDADRANAWRIVGALGVGCLLFVPWLPTFAYQMQHTGTPWDTAASPPTNTALTILDFAGGRMLEGGTGLRALVVLVLVELALLALTARKVSRWQLGVDLRTVPGVRWEWLIGAATLWVGLWVSFVVGSGFQSRYAAIVFPFFALAIAYGVTVLGDVRVRSGVLAFVVLVGFLGGARNVATNRTQASQVVDAIVGRARPGDVVGFCPDQLGPDVSRLLPPGLALKQYAFPRFQSPEFVDWVDYAARNRATSPTAYAKGLLQRAGDHRIWMVSATGYRTFGRKCEQITTALAAARARARLLVARDGQLFESMSLWRFDP